MEENPVENPQIPPESYDELYFDGANSTPPYGYSEYVREPRCKAEECPDHGGSGICGHEHFRTIAKKLVTRFDLVNKKVLELGCAKGFVVEDMFDFGADAYGVEISEYAVNCCENPQIRPRLTIAEAIAHLQTLPDNSFDFICGFRFLPCIAEENVPTLVSEMRRVAPEGYFTVDPLGTYQYEGWYNQQTLEHWIDGVGGNGYVIEQYKC